MGVTAGAVVAPIAASSARRSRTSSIRRRWLSKVFAARGLSRSAMASQNSEFVFVKKRKLACPYPDSAPSRFCAIAAAAALSDCSSVTAYRKIASSQSLTFASDSCIATSRVGVRFARGRFGFREISSRRHLGGHAQLRAVSRRSIPRSLRRRLPWRRRLRSWPRCSVRPRASEPWA